MYAQMDLDLQARAAHAVAALEHPETAFQNESFAAALTTARGLAAKAIAGHDAAAKAVEQDGQENRLAASAFTAAVSTSIDEYAWLRSDVYSRLLNVRPADLATLGPAQMQQRRELFDAAFAMTPTDIGDLGRTKATSRLGLVLGTLKASPLLDDAAYGAFATSVDQLSTAHQAVVDESLDDAPLQDALVAARARLGDTVVSLRELLSGFLRLEGSALSADAFLLRATKRTKADTPADPLAPAEAPAQSEPVV